MKKRTKKLVLAKETLRSLQEPTLANVVAGLSFEVRFCQPADTEIIGTNCDC